MLTTTANLCEGRTLNELDLYVGTHIGSFRALRVTHDGDSDPHKAKNLLRGSTDIGKACKVTVMEWANEARTELFLGKENQTLKMYKPKEQLATMSTLLSGVPVGCVRLSEQTIAVGLENGCIQFVDLDERSTAPAILITGDSMTRMRCCASKPGLAATGGKQKENNLKTWDLEAKKLLFTSKNVRPSELQLELPVWDTDMAFLTAHNIATCSRHGYIRLYDTRSQRRPVASFQSNDRDQHSFTCLAAHDNFAYVGLTVGGLQCFDLRHMKGPVHVYKGAIGSISDVSVAGASGQLLVSASLDRFVRIHSTETNALLYQSYVQSKVTRVLCNVLEDFQEKKHDEEDELQSILQKIPVAN